MALQFHSHRAKSEEICPLCEQPGGLDHAIWHCEARPLKLVCTAPARAEELPQHMRLLALALTTDDISRDLVDEVQDYMTRVLIARRLLQGPLDQKSKKRRRCSTGPDVVEVCSSGAEDSFEAEDHPERSAYHRGTCLDAAGSSGPLQPMLSSTQGEKTARHKRKKWDTSQLPPHIQLIQG
eukprot:3774142-Amphidinium_carterae.1